MKPSILAAAVGALLVTAPTVQAKLIEMKEPPRLDDVHTSPTAPIMIFVKAMNSDDWDKAASVVTASAIIADDTPPFQWRSFDDWRSSITKFRTALNITNYHMALMPFIDLSEGPGAGYSVQPATLSFEQNGASRTKRGFFTFTTAKIAGSWFITGWTWTDVERSDFWDNVAPEKSIY